MKWNHFVRENGLYFAWIVAMVATLGSLYISEILLIYPCKLCWFQRILMYPQAIILGIAAVRKDVSQVLYVLPMTIIGGCISIYHILVQKTTFFKEASSSCGPVPCDVEFFHLFGFLTIPMLALIAFILISTACIFVIRANRNA